MKLKEKLDTRWQQRTNYYTGSTDPRRKSQDVTGYHSFESRAPLSRRETSQGESRHIYTRRYRLTRTIRKQKAKSSGHCERISEIRVRRREALVDRRRSLARFYLDSMLVVVIPRCIVPQADRCLRCLVPACGSATALCTFSGTACGVPSRLSDRLRNVGSTSRDKDALAGA